MTMFATPRGALPLIALAGAFALGACGMGDEAMNEPMADPASPSTETPGAAPAGTQAIDEPRIVDSDTMGLTVELPPGAAPSRATNYAQTSCPGGTDAMLRSVNGNLYTFRCIGRS